MFPTEGELLTHVDVLGVLRVTVQRGLHRCRGESAPPVESSMTRGETMSIPDPKRGRIRRALLSAVSALTAGLLVVAGGVSAAQAAPPYATNGTLTSVDFVDDAAPSGSTVKVHATWSMPDNPTSPAGFSVPLPPELQGRSENFALTAPGDPSTIVGSCVVTFTSIDCDLDPAYVAANPLDLNGDVYFWVRILTEVDQDTEVTYDIGGHTSSITVQPGTPDCTENCELDWDYFKQGWYEYDTGQLRWWVHVKSEKGGMVGGERIRIVDTPESTHQMLIADGYPQLQRTKETAFESDGYERPQNFQTVPADQYTVDADGTISFVAEQGYYYQAAYISVPVDNVEFYGNHVDFYKNDVKDGEADFTTQVQGGGGTGIGTNVGVFTITKAVAGAPNLPADLVYSGGYTVTPPTGSPVTGTWQVTAGETFRSPTFPKGSTVVLTENPPTAPANVTWGQPAFSSNDFTLVGGQVSPVTVTNTATVKEGSFQAHKQIDGTAAAEAMIPAGTTFTVDYTYPAGPGFDAGSGSLELPADGTVVTTGELPVGAVLTFAEAPPAAVPGLAWGESTFMPATLTIGDGQVGQLTLTNVVSATNGTFRAHKELRGSTAATELVPADTTFTLNYSYPAGDGFAAGSGTLQVRADGTPVTSDELPAGAVVTVSEVAPAPVDGVVWGTPQVSPATVTIGAGQVVEVTVTNPVAPQPVPGYTFTKQSAPVTGSAVNPGDTITYTLIGSNTGETGLTPVDIRDDLTDVLDDADLNGPPTVVISGGAAGTPMAPAIVDGELFWSGSLDSGQSVTITYTVTVKADVVDATVKNNATSTATPPGEPPITPPGVTTEHPVPGYVFGKSANPASGTTVAAGGTITYTLAGENTGATDLDTVIRDDLSKVLDHAELTGAPVVTVTGQSAPPAATLSGTTLSWLGVLEPGQRVTVTYTVTLDDDAAGAIVNNRAHSEATPPGLPPITPPQVVTEHPVPGYEFSKIADPAAGTIVRPGDSIGYTLTGVNTGATALSPVVITDDLTDVLDDATLVAAPQVTITGGAPGAAPLAPVIIDGVLTWTGALEVGQTVAITYSVTLHDDAEGVLVKNTASSTATPPGEPPITPPTVVTEHPTPGFTLAKASNPATGTAVAPGDTITYTVTGENTGETVLDTVITDDLSNVLNNAKLTSAPVATIAGVDSVPAPVVAGTTMSWSGVLQPGQSIVITYTVTLNEDASGVIIDNRASAAATPPTTPPITPPDVVTEHPTPGYSFAKTSDPVSGTAVEPGDTITYTVTGVNSGETELDTLIEDDLSKVLNNASITTAPFVAIAGEDIVPAVQLDGTALSWNGVLKPGQTVTITYTVTVNDDAVGVLVNNHASSEATPPGLPPITPPDVGTEHPTPAYEFTKVSVPETGSIAAPGDVITYTVTGVNTGETDLDTVITDDMSKVLNNAKLTSEPVATIEGVDSVPAPVVEGTTVTWNGVLKPGQSVVITYAVTLNDDAVGVLVNNHASSEATPPGLPPITPPDVVTEHPTPNYEFTKTSNPASGTDVNPGDTITYTVTGKNTGMTELDTVITDDLSKVLEHATLTQAPVATIGGLNVDPAPVIDGSTLSWSGSLRPGQSVVITYAVTVNDDAAGVLIENSASSEATPPGEPPLVPPTVVTEHPTPAYAFAKASDPASGTAVAAGDEITYTLTGDNTGRTDLDTVITDDLSSVLNNAALTSAPIAVIEGEDTVPAPVMEGTTLTWSGALAPGQTLTITYVVTVNDDVAGVLIENSASSEATPPTTTPITPPTVVTVHPTPGYEFTKTANPATGATVQAGQEITYTLTGVNTGETDLDTVITDDLSQVLSFATIATAPVATMSTAGDATPVTLDGTDLSWRGVLPKGERITITYSVIVNAGVEGETLRNRASSTATPPGLPPITPPSVVTEHPVPGYEFTKSSDPASGTAVRPGQKITYTLTGVNTGATALDAVIADDLSAVLAHATLSGDPVVAIPGESDVPGAELEGTTLTWNGVLKVGQTVTITYAVTVNDDAEGVIVRNTASSEATPPGVPPITPPTVETWHPTPGYTFMKTADPASGSSVMPGDVITYTLTGTNAGETVLDAVIEDDLSKVLEFATLTGEPVASIAGASDVPAAKLDGASLTWSGKLDKGQQVTVVYSVTVKKGVEGKTLGNHASSEATPPGLPPITPPDVVTEHPVPGYEFGKTSNPVSGTAVAPGGTITYTLTGVNTGATELQTFITDDLSKVLNNAELTSKPVVVIEGESDVPAAVLEGTTLTWSGVLKVGQTVTITYAVTVNEGTEGVIVNNHASSTATPPGLPPITPPSVVTEHPVPGYTLAKVSSPGSGATVKKGQTVSYTVTGANTGATALRDVSIMDDMSDVLDDATLTATPVAVIVTASGSKPAPTAAEMDGTTLFWSGSLQVGERVVITYAVTVGDMGPGDTLRNTVASTGVPPTGTEITPEPPTTVNPGPPAPGRPLPATGAGDQGGAIALGALFLIGGAAIYLVRRRRAEA